MNIWFVVGWLNRCRIYGYVGFIIVSSSIIVIVILVIMVIKSMWVDNYGFYNKLENIVFLRDLLDNSN